MENDQKSLLNFSGVADLLMIPEQTIRQKYTEWGMPHLKIGRHIRFSPQVVIVWAESNSLKISK